MKGINLTTTPDGQPSLLTIDLKAVNPEADKFIAPLLKAIKSEDEEEQKAFLEMSAHGLNLAYGLDEPEYTLDDAIRKR